MHVMQGIILEIRGAFFTRGVWKLNFQDIEGQPFAAYAFYRLSTSYHMQSTTAQKNFLTIRRDLISFLAVFFAATVPFGAGFFCVLVLCREQNSLGIDQLAYSAPLVFNQILPSES